jgi:outer membrane protein assembly factor BamB
MVCVTDRISRRRHAALLVLALTMAGCGLLPGSGGPPEVDGPHRVAASAAAQADSGAGTPEMAKHHWIALAKAWQVSHVDDVPKHYALASDGDRVFFLTKEIGGGPTAQATAYDGATGKRLWRAEVPWTGTAAPLAAAGTLVVPAGDARDTTAPIRFVGVDAASGRERWRVEARQRTCMDDAPNLPLPTCGAVLDGVFYYADGRGVYGVDLTTGKVRHRVVSKTKLAIAGPVTVRDKIALTVRLDPTIYHKGDTSVRRLVVLDKGLRKVVRDVAFPPHLSASRLAVSGDIVAVSGAGEDARVWSVDTKTGRILWSHRLPGQLELGAAVSGTLVLLDTSVPNRPQFVGYDLLTGAKLWRLGPKESEHYSDRTLGVADGTLFGLGHGVEIVDERTGKVPFAYQFTPRGGGRVVAAHGRIVIHNHDGLMAFK